MTSDKFSQIAREMAEHPGYELTQGADANVTIKSPPESPDGKKKVIVIGTLRQYYDWRIEEGLANTRPDASAGDSFTLPKVT